MIFKDFKIYCNSQVKADYERVEDVDFLFRTNDAITTIANKTTPIILLTNDGNRIDLLRKLSEGEWLRRPRRVMDDNEDIDLDDGLLRALALYVAAGLSPRQSSTTMGIFYDEIRDFERNLSSGEDGMQDTGDIFV